MPGPVVIVFGAILLVVMALVYAFSGSNVVITARLGHIWKHSNPSQGAFREKRQQFVAWVLATLAKVFPSTANPQTERVQLLHRAGYRRPEAIAAFRVVGILLPVTLVACVYLTGFYRRAPFFIFLFAGVLGYVLPGLWLGFRVRSRQQRLTLALPDALDLLVICVEAGLGLDQAMLYISQELRIAHRDLCDELDLANAEVRVGKTRSEALRSLASRTDVEDIKVLVATLVQTERFGTSVAQALRMHSDELRTKRRQRAEELAARTTVKMVIPLVFFIFPALFVVILGPAIISLIRHFGPLQK